MIKQELEWPAFDEVEFDASMDSVHVVEQMAESPVFVEAVPVGKRRKVELRQCFPFPICRKAQYSKIIFLIMFYRNH